VLTTIGRIIYNDRNRAGAGGRPLAMSSRPPVHVRQPVDEEARHTRLIDLLVADLRARPRSRWSSTRQGPRVQCTPRRPASRFSKNAWWCRRRSREILDKYDKLVGDITGQYDDGLITQEERHEAVVEQWNAATDEVADAMVANLDTLNPIFMMANFGCSWVLQADPPAGGHARPDGQPKV